MKTRLVGMLLFGISLLVACSSNKVKNQVMGDMDDVKVVDLKSMRSNNLLVAKGYLHNITKSTAQVYYRCLFYDVNQVPLGDAPAWKFATVHVPDYAYADIPVTCQATDVNAVDFKIELSNSSATVTTYK